MRLSRAGRRRGAVLVAVLVVLMTASILLGAMLRTGREEQRMLRSQQMRLQAMELAQAAIDRAAARLTTDANYTGETWRLSPAEMGSRAAAAVTIDVQTPADRPRRREVRIDVNYQVGGQTAVRQRHHSAIDLPEKDSLP